METPTSFSQGSFFRISLYPRTSGQKDCSFRRQKGAAQAGALPLATVHMNSLQQGVVSIPLLTYEAELPPGLGQT